RRIPDDPFQVREVDAADQQADGRHDDVGDQRTDDLAERTADDHGDGQIYHVAAHDESLEVAGVAHRVTSLVARIPLWPAEQRNDSIAPFFGASERYASDDAGPQYGHALQFRPKFIAALQRSHARRGAGEDQVTAFQFEQLGQLGNDVRDRKDH